MYSDIILAEDNSSFVALSRRLGYSSLHLRKNIHLRIVDGVSDAVNRKTVERKGAHILLNPHQRRGKDHLHFRNSGLNHVLCKFAHDNNVAIGLTFNFLQSSSDLGKVRQNILLCKKYKVPLFLFSFARHPFELLSAQDALSLLRYLGMDAGDAKRALSFASYFHISE